MPGLPPLLNYATLASRPRATAWRLQQGLGPVGSRLNKKQNFLPCVASMPVRDRRSQRGPHFTSPSTGRSLGHRAQDQFSDRSEKSYKLFEKLEKFHSKFICEGKKICLHSQLMTNQIPLTFLPQLSGGTGCHFFHSTQQVPLTFNF